MSADNTFAELLGLTPLPRKRYGTTVHVSIETFLDGLESGYFTDDQGWAYWATETHYEWTQRVTYDSQGYIVGGQNGTIDLLAFSLGELKPPHWATHIFWKSM